MLIEMSVANFRSFRETQTFTLVKGKGDEMVATNTFNAAAANNIALLRSAAIYGPNASGKSNLLLALQTMNADAGWITLGWDIPAQPTQAVSIGAE